VSCELQAGEEDQHAQSQRQAKQSLAAHRNRPVEQCAGTLDRGSLVQRSDEGGQPDGQEGIGAAGELKNGAASISPESRASA
jgi:hypothetical protein